MSFEQEWAQFKADAVRSSVVPTGHSAPREPALADVDLGLLEGPIRTKASEIRLANADAKEKSKLDDAAAVGANHSCWAAGPASSQCVSAWQRRLHALSDMVEDAADALSKATNRQISDDATMAQRL